MSVEHGIFIKGVVKVTKKTGAEKLADIDKKLEQLKAQKQALIAREKENERKERNHRLIQIGAEIESRLKLSVEDTKSLCDYFNKHPESLDKVKRYIEQNKKSLEN